MMTVTVGMLFVLIFINQCQGVLRFANYLQDHMVLQRAPQRAILWGYGAPGTLTTLTIDGKTYPTVSRGEPMNSQNESTWSVTLDPISAEGPFPIHVSQPLTNGTNVTISLQDILFGDVWLCSGQSNMEITIGAVYNGSEEIANAGSYPKIRVFTVQRTTSSTPVEEIIEILLKWSVASPQSIGGGYMAYMSAVCWLYGRMIHQALNGRPIGLVASSYYGTAIELWMPPSALQECNQTTPALAITDLPRNHSCLYNAMIYPLTRMVIYGVIWYQGEANCGSSGNDLYACSFSKMISSWRQLWHQRTEKNTDLEFPFGFVQLSTESNTSDLIGCKPWIRWYQTFGIGYVPNHVLPRMFMAVALDLRDDVHGVHPRYKHDVGYRLSRSGLAIAYNQSIEYQGPIVESVSYFNGSETFNVTYRAVSGIEVRNSSGFEICCQGERCSYEYIWIPANITSQNGLTITVTVEKSCVGQSLYGIRYLWRETPCLFKQAAIYSLTDSNLPSPPYRKLF